MSGTPEPDETRAATRALAGHLRSGMLVLMIDLGHRLGLFEALAGAGPVTAADLAARAGCAVRPVEEWLGAMATGGIVSLDRDRYELPAAMGSVLTGAGATNLARLAAQITVLAPVVPTVVEAFRTGAGVGYDAYPGFAALMDAGSRPLFDDALVDGYLASCPGLVDRLRREDLHVLDVGCGTGHAMNVLAAAFPRALVTGIDLGGAAIDAARAEAASMRLTNSSFEVGDALALPIAPPWDLICAFDAIHDQADPAGVLARIRTGLREDGTFLMVDVKARTGVAANLDHAMGPWLYGTSVLHCLQVSLAGGGPGLGTCWGREQAEAMLAAAGFTSVEVQTIPADRANLVYCCR